MTTTSLPNVDHLPTADRTERIRSFMGKAVALRHAKDYANMNTKVEDREVEAGEVFEARGWNGSEHINYWLAYTVTMTGEGFTISSHRWYTNPEA
jgi:hypothetical protein